MQKIERSPLPSTVLDELHALALLVEKAADRKKEALRLWDNLKPQTKAAIKETLISMSTGLERCMYCEDGQGTDIEHFRPKSTYPLDTFSWLNYLLACAHCNSNYKRTKFPLDKDGTPLLINPADDDPVEHLGFSPTTGLIGALDIRGESTVVVCGLNRGVCVHGRLDAWVGLAFLIKSYAREKSADRAQRAARIRQVITRHPFQSVRLWMSRAIREGDADEYIDDEVVEIIRQHPELLSA